MKRIVRLTESDLTRIVNRVISEQKQSFSKGYNQGQTAGKQTQQTIKGGLQKAGQFVKGATEQLISIAGQTIKAVFVGNLVVFILAGRAIKVGLDVGKKILSFLGSLGKTFGKVVVSGAKAVGNFAKNTIDKAATDVKFLYNTIFGMLKKVGGKLYSGALEMASKIGDIWNNISSWASGALNSVKKAVGDVYNTASNAVGSAYNQASQVAGNVGGFVSGLFSEGIIEMMLEDYHYYNSLPIKKMINEIYFDNRNIL